MAVPHCIGEEQGSAQDQLQQRRGPAATRHVGGLSHDFFGPKQKTLGHEH